MQNHYHKSLPMWSRSNYSIKMIMVVIIIIIINCIENSNEFKFKQNWSIHKRIDNEFEPEFTNAFLYSEKIQMDDLFDVIEHLKNYVSRYDHKIVCAKTDLQEEGCQIAVSKLALHYFEEALNNTKYGLESKVWRKIEDGAFYGALIVLNPKQGEDDEINQILRTSTYVRDACASLFLKLGTNEHLRYIRLYAGTDKSIANIIQKKMTQQFVEESTQEYLCSEFKEAGEHRVGIFANRNSVIHFTKFGFEVQKCGEELYEACRNIWFRERCLLSKLITARTCHSQ